MEEATVYTRIGGESGLHAIVDRFYELMDTLPAAKEIRDMHPADLSNARERLFWFLSGWMGGPQLYWEKIGHPRLRARHLPFAIDSDAAKQWMLCMIQTLNEQIPDEELRNQLLQSFVRVAAHMRNKLDAD